MTTEKERLLLESLRRLTDYQLGNLIIAMTGDTDEYMNMLSALNSAHERECLRKIRVASGNIRCDAYTITPAGLVYLDGLEAVHG